MFLCTLKCQKDKKKTFLIVSLLNLFFFILLAVVINQLYPAFVFLKKNLFL